MLDRLYAAWRGRRALVIGAAHPQVLFTKSLLDALGAKTARLPPDVARDTLFRALSASRVSAVLVPQAHLLTDSADPFEHLRAADTLLTEIRESGVPLTLLCSSEYVYRSGRHSWYAREDDPPGGMTRGGLTQALVQLYADGVSRGLLGSPVRTICLRHMPCLASGDAQTGQYARWCRQLLRDEIITVEHPSQSGVFLHPLEAALGAAALGARFFSGEDMEPGAFNLGADAKAICTNRSAALRLLAANGGKRPIRETEPPQPAPAPLLDGTLLSGVCALHTVLPADEALCALLSLERAMQADDAAVQAEIVLQTQQFLERMA